MQSWLKKTDFSKIFLLLLPVFFIVYTEASRADDKETYIVIRSDAQFYHEYIAVELFGHAPYTARTERPVIKYSMGMALSYLPCVGVAYVISELQGIDHDYGRNFIYQKVLFYNGFLYAMLGLVFLRLFLKRWMDSWIVAIVLAIIFFATNLYFYVWVEPLMAHAVCFFVITGFLYAFMRYFDRPSARMALWMGVFLGFSVLIRPTNMIIILIPALYFLCQPTSLHEKIRFLKQSIVPVFIVGVMAFFCFLPQMIYWHHYTGKWLYYSYTHEKFFWEKPAILQVLFSFRKGWFVYTPVMILMFPGMLLAWKNNKPLLIAMLVFSLLNIYIISSWWCWWYGGSFGMRTMIDTYAIYALWIGLFIQYVWKKWKPGFVMLAALIVFLGYVNLFQTRQARLCRIHFDSMSYAAYKKVFLNNDFNFSREEWEAALDPPDYEAAQKGLRFW